MRENRTSGSMRRGEKRVMVHSANGHRTRKGGNSGAPPDLYTTALALHSTPVGATNVVEPWRVRVSWRSRGVVVSEQKNAPADGNQPPRTLEARAAAGKAT